MKKYLFTIIIGLLLVGIQFLYAGNISQGLKGKILLQVEENGEAWYVNPQNSKRYYLGRPDDAFIVMRNQGVGITNENLYKIPVGITVGGKDSDKDGLSDYLETTLGLDKDSADSDNDGFTDREELDSGYSPWGSGKQKINLSFAKQQAGRILLQVEKSGEAWYVEPSSYKRYFLGRPSDAFGVMRGLGLGIRNKDLQEIATDENDDKDQQGNDDSDENNEEGNEQSDDNEQNDNNAEEENEDLGDVVADNSSFKLELIPEERDVIYAAAGENILIGYLKMDYVTTDIKLTSVIFQVHGDATIEDIKHVQLGIDENPIYRGVPDANGIIQMEFAGWPGVNNIPIYVQTKSINAFGDSEGTATNGRTIQLSIAGQSSLQILDLNKNSAISAEHDIDGPEIELVEDKDGSVEFGEYSNPSKLTSEVIILACKPYSVGVGFDCFGFATGTNQLLSMGGLNFECAQNRTPDNQQFWVEVKEIKIKLDTSPGTKISNLYVATDKGYSSPINFVNGVATIDATKFGFEKTQGINFVIKGDVENTDSDPYYTLGVPNLTTDIIFNPYSGQGIDYTGSRAIGYESCTAHY